MIGWRRFATAVTIAAAAAAFTVRLKADTTGDTPDTTLVVSGFPPALARSLASFGGTGSGTHAAQASTPRFDVVEKSILELQNAMDAGRVTSRQLVEQYLARIDAYDQRGPAINAFISLNPRALDEAAARDEERRVRKTRGPLHGIPIVVKDNYATVDLPTTGGSLALEQFHAGRDAFMVKKLRDAGAVIIGKTNLHELAYGITSISSMGGQTRNPYDPTRNPGGSSGGTGAAVAASFAAAGLGTDTCGSIRIPAANNNLFGLRGTQGLSSRDGIIPLSHSQDIGGPITRSVTDLAIMLDATVGFDPSDEVTRASEGRIPRTFLAFIGDSSIGEVHIGRLTPLFGSAPGNEEDEEVAAVVRKAIGVMETIGATASDQTIAGFDTLLQGASTINAEFKFDLMDYLAKYRDAPVRSLDDILRGGLFHTAVEGVLRRSNQVESRNNEAYDAILAKRAAVRQTILDVMHQRGLTVLGYPVLRRKPAPIGQAQAGSNCQLSATTGLPAISIPAGFTADGLPVGLELLGQPFSETMLLKIAYAYERVMQPRRAPAATPPLVGSR
jgi:Asp-tRNA(Asn)/Glu-tRNA(Gln) amidotransferase A subunit family amidase